MLAVGNEYSTGMIKLSLTAMPRRLTWLFAKAAVLTAPVLAASALAVAGAALAGRLILPGRRRPAGTGRPRLHQNLHSISCDQRRFDEADRCFADGVAYCDEHDIGTYATALRGARADALENLGRWRSRHR